MNRKKTAKDTVRASVTEHLTLVIVTGESNIQSLYADENVWFSQKVMGLFYDVDVGMISYHLQKTLSDNELDEKLIVQDFRITADDGKTYSIKHYNLSAIITVGYKVDSERVAQLCKWAAQIIQEFVIKGSVTGDERPKNDGMLLGKKYFEEQLQHIREIRLSECKSYQEITDIYTTSIDHDPKSASTQCFLLLRKINCIGRYTNILL